MLMPGQRGAAGTLSGIHNCRHIHPAPHGHAGKPRRAASAHAVAATAAASAVPAVETYGDRYAPHHDTTNRRLYMLRDCASCRLLTPMT